MKKFLATFFLVILISCSKESDNAIKQLPAGAYKLDKTHASLIFRVNHLGLSHYTARFKSFDADLEFDPKNPTAAQITATIDPRSIETDFPKEKLDFNATLQNSQWLDAAKFPQIKFRSTKVVITGKNMARVGGELDLHGVTVPLTLDVKFNGGYLSHPFDPSGTRIGFSGHGTLKRSDFGISFGIPEKGSQMGVSDEVEFFLEVEFTKPLAEKSSKEISEKQKQ